MMSVRLSTATATGALPTSNSAAKKRIILHVFLPTCINCSGIHVLAICVVAIETLARLCPDWYVSHTAVSVAELLLTAPPSTVLIQLGACAL
jgi:hypothetical protein